MSGAEGALTEQARSDPDAPWPVSPTTAAPSTVSRIFAAGAPRRAPARDSAWRNPVLYGNPANLDEPPDAPSDKSGASEAEDLPLALDELRRGSSAAAGGRRSTAVSVLGCSLRSLPDRPRWLRHCIS